MAWGSGSLVWVNDPDQGWLQGTVVSQSAEMVQVELVIKVGYIDGAKVLTIAKDETISFPEHLLIELDEASLEDYEDMVKIDALSEPVLLHNLQQRYERDLIYTRIGSVLVSLNPFKHMNNLYGPEQSQLYKNGGKNLPPHIYQISSNAYNNLKRQAKSQAILVSGESGAGKTEAAKAILKSLAVISSSGGSGSIGNIEKKILESNPLLEAFGNARTVCNNNSSRFGKFIQVIFSRKGKISGAVIDTYLLEKSRIAWQAQGERNYHVFYQLLRGAEPSYLEDLRLLSTKCCDYLYVSQSGCDTIKSVNDATEFTVLVNAMSNIGISPTEQKEIFSIVASVLHLGNIKFIPKNGKGGTNPDVLLEIENPDVVESVAHLLGIPCSLVEKNLLSRDFRGAGRGSVYSIPLELGQAQEARDALAKALYNRLFNVLVSRVNQHLQEQHASGGNSKEKTLRIGVLDIFGFEIFEKNSFEQILINFANEKLQCQFNQSMFAAEQEEYAKEGIQWDSIDFSDNQPCVDLIESKPYGILPMLDEECRVPRGSELKLLEKLKQKHIANSMFVPSKTTGYLGVSHYAGEVSYSIENWMEKNRDTLPEDINSLLQSSSVAFVAELFPQEVESGNSTRKARKLSVSQSFSKQLGRLMSTLSEMEQHYVRCVKPNQNSEANSFYSEYTLRQLRCAGLMDTIRIRKAGFAYRRNFEAFLERFSYIKVSGHPNWAQGDAKVACMVLLENIKEEEPSFLGWTLGHSKVFLRAVELSVLEKKLDEAVHCAVASIERVWKFSLIRKRWCKLSRAVLDQEAVRKKEEERKLKEEERKRKEQEERKHREEEERRRKEEEERKQKQQEENRRWEQERKRKEQEERKHREEEERRRKRREEEEERERKEGEERKKVELQQEREKEKQKERLIAPAKSNGKIPPPVSPRQVVTKPLATPKSPSRVDVIKQRPQELKNSIQNFPPPLSVVARPAPIGGVAPRGRTQSPAVRGRNLPPPTAASIRGGSIRKPSAARGKFPPPTAAIPRGNTQSPAVRGRTAPPPPSTVPRPLPVVAPRGRTQSPAVRGRNLPPPTPASIRGGSSRKPSAARGNLPPFTSASIRGGSMRKPSPTRERNHSPPNIQSPLQRANNSPVRRQTCSPNSNKQFRGKNRAAVTLRNPSKMVTDPQNITGELPRVRGRGRGHGIIGRGRGGGRSFAHTNSQPNLKKSIIDTSSQKQRPVTRFTTLTDPEMTLRFVATLQLPVVTFDGQSKEVHRQRVLNEFIATEKGYLEDMDILFEVFLFPLRKLGLLTKQEIQSIFINLEAIVNINVIFMMDLMKHIDRFCDKKDFPLGSTFLKSIAFFNLYMEFCIKQPEQFRMLDLVQKENTNFADFLKRCEEIPRCRGLFLNSFLIKPTQRICKYPLLLNDIIKHTPDDHPDLPNLQQSLVEIKMLLDTINERKRQEEGRIRVITISEKLEGCDISLITPTRKYMKESTLEVTLSKGKRQEYLCILFNDLILVLREKKNDYDCKTYFELEKSKIVIIADEGGTKFAWDLENTETEEIAHFYASSMEEKKEWSAPIQKAIKDFQRKRLMAMKK